MITVADQRKAAQDSRTPRRFAPSPSHENSARSWSAAVLCRFGSLGERDKGFNSRALWIRGLDLFCLALLLPSLSGCVSESKAKAKEREAYIAGEQAAMARMAEAHDKPVVSFIGPFQNPLVPWTHDLTLAKAIIAAGYLGTADPTHIMIVRKGQAIPIDPKRLLSGEDIPLASGDLVQISQ